MALFSYYLKNTGKYLAGIGAAIGLGFLLSQSVAQQEKPVERDFRYAVVVSQDTYNRKDWKKTPDRLIEKHGGKLFVWDERIEETADGLKEYQPTHATCVGRPSEMAISGLGNDWRSELEAVRKSLPGRFYDILNKLDDDPYPDSFGGIITGYTAEDALKLADSGSFTIDTVLGKGFEPPIYMVRNGLVFGEAKDHDVGEGKPKMVKRIRKIDGKMTVEGVDSAGEDFLDFINTGNPGFVGFGGHAGGDNIALGYRYLDIGLECKDGIIYGVLPPDKVIGKIESPNPKVYASATNCRFSLIKSRTESTALAFIHSGGGVQLFGLMSDAGQFADGVGNYIGHGFKAHLIETSENPTFFEALKMAQISNLYAFQKVNKSKSAIGVPENQLLPEEIDKVCGHHAFIGIGDPAVDIRFDRVSDFVSPVTKNSPQPKFNEDGTITYRFELNTGEQQATLQRSPVYLLSAAIEPIKGVKIESSSKDLVFVLGDDFVLLDVGETIDRDQEIGLRLNRRPIEPDSNFYLEITAKRKN